MSVSLRSLCAALLTLLLAAPAARADHTPVPGTVALVGSLQSELGCPGDWQPECPQTRLAARRRLARRVPGDLRRPGRRL